MMAGTDLSDLLDAHPGDPLVQAQAHAVATLVRARSLVANAGHVEAAIIVGREADRRAAIAREVATWTLTEEDGELFAAMANLEVESFWRGFDCGYRAAEGDPTPFSDEGATG